MFNTPNILVSSAENFIDWTLELANKCLDAAPELRTLFLKSDINNKDYFSISDDKIFIQYTLLCLAYGQLEPGIYQDSAYKIVITEKVEKILKSMELENKGIAFITSIEDQTTSILNSNLKI